MSKLRPKEAEKYIMAIEIAIDNNSPGSSCQRVLASAVNLRVLIASLSQGM